MPQLAEQSPRSRVEPVTEILHGIAITDPYRWLEDGSTPDTHAWLREQSQYTKAYFEGLTGRDEIRERVSQLLDIETCDSFQSVGARCIFRKRLAGREQPSIYLREGPDGEDQMLLNPEDRGTSKYTAFRPLQLSQDGRLLLYEVKQGGEKAAIFELFDIEKRRILPDALPMDICAALPFRPMDAAFITLTSR